MEKNCSIDSLPDEVLLKLFTYFEQKDLCLTLSPVCKRWWTLSKNPLLWKSLSLKVSSEDTLAACCSVLEWSSLLCSLIVKSEISMHKLMKQLVSLTSLKELDLGFSDGLNSKSLKIVALNAPQIEILSLENCSKGVDIKGIHHVVSLPKLRALDLTGCDRVNDECVISIARKCLNLETLNLMYIDDNITDISIQILAECRQDTLTHLYLSGERLTDKSMKRLSACQELKTLSVSCISFSKMSLVYLSTLSNLTWLSLGACIHWTERTLESFFKTAHLSKLQVLEIWDDHTNSKIFASIAKRCKDLRVLSLPKCMEIRDSDFIGILDGCKNLKWLTINANCMLTKQAFSKIPDKCPNLMFLNVHDCRGPFFFIILELVEKMPKLKVFVKDPSYAQTWNNWCDRVVYFNLENSEDVIWMHRAEDFFFRPKCTLQKCKLTFT